MQAEDGTIGVFLRGLRKSQGATMETAALRAGIHRVTLHRWETGRAQPRLPELDALLGALEAGPKQRQAAVALVDAPRARTVTRLDRVEAAAQTGLEPPPRCGAGNERKHGLRRSRCSACALRWARNGRRRWR